MIENEISNIILGACIKIHKALGPGLLESVYESILYHEVKNNLNLHVLKQKAIPVIYEDVKLDIGFRADLIIENKVLVEIKSVEKIHDVHKKQVLTYLKLTDIKLGLLINFNESLLKNGVTRIVNNL